MKKILSIILSALIILSVFSVGAFATEAESTRFYKWMNKVESDNEVAFTVNFRLGGYLMSFMETTAFLKGEQLAMLVNYNDTELKIIEKDGDLYIFPIKFPFVHYKMESAGILGGSNESSNIDYSFNGEYELKLEDKTYIVEEYTVKEDSQEQQLIAYFDGDELKHFVLKSTFSDAYIDTDMDVELVFEIIPGEIDDDIFKMPWFSIDVTFLVDTLLMFGIIPMF